MEKSHESYFSVTDCNSNFTVYGSIPVEKKEEKKKFCAKSDLINIFFLIKFIRTSAGWGKKKY